MKKKSLIYMKNPQVRIGGLEGNTRNYIIF